MDVKIRSNAPASPPPQQRPAQAAEKPGASFAAALKAAGGQKDAAQSPEEVFARALADREHPDFDLIDNFLEDKIKEITK